MRFLVDAMCGKLARYLRMCGHDAAYALDRGVEDDDELQAWATEENRRIVTRDAALAARASDAVLLQSKAIDGQLVELRAAGIDLALTDPERCGRCNGALEQIAAEASTPDDTPDPRTEPVWRCVDCGQHFWRGSHWDDVAARLAEK